MGFTQTLLYYEINRLNRFIMYERYLCQSCTVPLTFYYISKIVLLYKFG